MNQPSHGSEEWALRVYPVADSDSGRWVLERWCRDRFESALRQLTLRVGLSCSLQDAPRIVAVEERKEGLSAWTIFRWTAPDNNSIGYLSVETRWLWRCLMGFLGERAELCIPEGPMSGLELFLAESAIQPLEEILGGCLVPGIERLGFAQVPTTSMTPHDRSGPHDRWTMWQAICRVGEVTGALRLAVHSRVVDEVLVGSEERRGMQDSDDQTAMRLDALLVHSQVSGQGWGDLQKGDIVDCQRSVDEPVLLCIEGKPAYWAKLGLANGRRAVQILSAVE
ncbi:MAG: FliM/FliN family flagellar motor switch protein [Pirellulaceae bacterium]